VLSASSLFFDAGGSVCRCMCVYTHTLHMEYSDLSSGVGMRHLEVSKNADGINLGIHVFVYMYKVYIYVYNRRQDEIFD